MNRARTYRCWMRSEIEIVRREYPAGGAKRVAKQLPHRSLVSIYGRASALGLKRPGSRGRPAHG